MTITGNFEDSFLEDVQKLQEEGFPAFDIDLYASLARLCRVCAKPRDDMVPIFSGRGQQLCVEKMIHGHLPIKVTKYDKLPVQLCSLCTERLLACEMLATECAQADRKLKALLTKSSVVDDKVLLQVGDYNSELLLESEIGDADDKMREEAVDHLSEGADMLRLDCHDQTVDSLICDVPCELMLDASDPIVELGEASYNFYPGCRVDHCGSLETSPTWNEILEVAEMSGSEEMGELHQQTLQGLDLDVDTSTENKKFGQNTETVEMKEDNGLSGLNVKGDGNCRVKTDVENLFQTSSHIKFTDSENDVEIVDSLAESEPLVEEISEVTVMTSGEMLPGRFENNEIVGLSDTDLNMSSTMLSATDAINIVNKDSSVPQLELLRMQEGQSRDDSYCFITDLNAFPSSDVLGDISKGTEALNLPFQQHFARVSVIDGQSSAESKQAIDTTSVTVGNSVADKTFCAQDNGITQQNDIRYETNIPSHKAQTLESKTSGANCIKIPVIKVLPHKSPEVKEQNKYLYGAVKVKRASHVNMIVLKADHLQKPLPQSAVMASILEAVRKKMNMNLQQDKIPSKAVSSSTIASEEKVSTEVSAVENGSGGNIGANDRGGKPIRMENVAKLQLVNVELMQKLAPKENHPPKQMPCLYMRVAEKFNNVEENPKNAIVGAIHNLVSHTAMQKQKESMKEKEQGYHCTVCGVRFDLWRAWRTHEREHRLGVVPKCSTCHKVFKNENSLRYHVRRHILGTPTKRYMCEACNKTFYSHAAANDHSRIHTGERPFGCPTCGKTFIRKFALKMHQRSHLRTHNPKLLQPKFVCVVCGEELPTESAWKAHSRLHLEETPRSCGMCHRHFTSTANFKSHQKKCGKSTSAVATSISPPNV